MLNVLQEKGFYFMVKVTGKNKGAFGVKPYLILREAPHDTGVLSIERIKAMRTVIGGCDMIAHALVVIGWVKNHTDK